MIKHTDLGTTPFTRTKALQQLIAKGGIKLAGYSRGKIYGTLSCGSGKKMKMENRVFFANETEALAAGYRPCGNCMLAAYKLWKQKNGTI